MTRQTLSVEGSKNYCKQDLVDFAFGLDGTSYSTLVENVRFPLGERTGMERHVSKHSWDGTCSLHQLDTSNKNLPCPYIHRFARSILQLSAISSHILRYHGISCILRYHHSILIHLVPNRTPSVLRSPNPTWHYHQLALRGTIAQPAIFVNAYRTFVGANSSAKFPKNQPEIKGQMQLRNQRRYKLNKVPSPCTKKKTPGKRVQRKNSRFCLPRILEYLRKVGTNWSFSNPAPQDPSLLVIETLPIIPVFQKQRVVVFYSSKGGCNMTADATSIDRGNGF